MMLKGDGSFKGIVMGPRRAFPISIPSGTPNWSTAVNPSLRTEKRTPRVTTSEAKFMINTQGEMGELNVIASARAGAESAWGTGCGGGGGGPRPPPRAGGRRAVDPGPVRGRSTRRARLHAAERDEGRGASRPT